MFDKMAKIFFEGEKGNKMEFRKLCSRINRILKTVEVYQCSQEWSAIDFPTMVTGTKLIKNVSAFLKTNNQDRILCADHFREYVQELKDKKVQDSGSGSGSGSVGIRSVGSKIGLDQFGKAAMELYHKKVTKGVEVDLLNVQWRDFVEGKKRKRKKESESFFLPIVNVMHPDYCVGCAMACFLLELMPFLGKGVFTVGFDTKWHCLDTCATFMERMYFLLREKKEPNVENEMNILKDVNEVVDNVFKKNADWDRSLLKKVVIFGYSQDESISLWNDPFDLFPFL
jgi:hypothetical protein